MPQDTFSILREARANAQRPTSQAPPRVTSSFELLMEARQNARRAIEGQARIIPIRPGQDPEDLLVTRVIDGDTIEVEGVGAVRLTGYNTPETVHPNRGVERLGPESSQLATLMLLGRKVRVTPQAGDERDVYGRTLATVTLPDGRIANAELGAALARFTPKGGTTPRDARTALGQALNASILRGLIYPIGALVPELYSSLSTEIESAKQTLHKFMQEPQVFEAMGRPSDTIQGIIAGAPTVAGEVLGGLAPGLGLFKASQSAFRVAKGLSVAERVKRNFAAGVAAGTGFGAAAHLEDGESRWARVARDAVIAGAAETVFLPFMIRAWREELGTAADKAVKQISLKEGVSVREAERRLTAMRTGANPTDFESAESIVDAAKSVPEMRGTPTYVQASKTLGLLDRVLPPESATVDPALPKAVALAFDLEIDGQRMPIRLAGRASGLSEQEVVQSIDGVVSQVGQALSVGRGVYIRNPVVRDIRSWEFFKNRLLNRQMRKPPEGKPLGSAPKGSVAETGKMPEVGDQVAVVQDNGQRTRAQVLEIGEYVPLRELISTETGIQEERLVTSVMPATVARLNDAGFSDAEIRGLSELDMHVGATLATPGAQNRQQKVLRTWRERANQGSGLVAPTDLEKYTHFSVREALDNGLDFEEYVTALTQHVLNGGELTAQQSRSFPYLAQLSRRVRSLVAPEEVLPELGPVAVGRAVPRNPAAREAKEVYAREVESRRTVPAEGEIFHEEGGLTRESEVRVARATRTAKRTALQTDIDRLRGDISRETDPARRAQLEGFLRNAEADLAAVSEVTEPTWTSGRVKKTPPGHIVVNGPNGREIKHVAQVFVDSPIVQAPQLGRKAFVAHPDGGERRGIVHLTQNEISLEPVGANTAVSENFFRSELFSSVDPEKDFGHDVPFFIHADGSVDLSIVPTQSVILEKQASFGHRFEFGPQDILEARREKNVGGVRRSGEEVLGLTGSEPPAFGRFPAGYAPRATRGPIEVDVRARPLVSRRGMDDAVDESHRFYSKSSGDLIEYGEDYDDAVLLAGGEPEVRPRGRRRTTRALPVAPSELRGFHMQTGMPVRRQPTEGPLEYFLTREDLIGREPHPEWATVRKTAQALLKDGYEPATPIRVSIAREAHRPVPEAPTVMTLREAAEMKLPLPNSDRLRDEAAARGISVLPKGRGSELVFPDGSKQVFQTDLEAMEAVTRVPVTKLDRKLEAGLERSWNMGTENGVDPDVDARAFVPVKLQEIVLKQIGEGRRPLAEVRTGSVSEFNSAFEVITRAMPRGRNVQVQTIEELPGGGARLAVFDPELVRARAIQNGQSLLRLGVDPNADPRLIVGSLDQVPQGLHIMQSQDPESAIMYSWMRQHSMKGNWEQGQVVIDETGPHRVFTPEQKASFTFRICNG